MPWKAVEDGWGDWSVEDGEGNVVAAFTACYEEGAIPLEEEDAKLIADAVNAFQKDKSK